MFNDTSKREVKGFFGTDYENVASYGFKYGIAARTVFDKPTPDFSLVFSFVNTKKDKLKQYYIDTYEDIKKFASALNAAIDDMEGMLEKTNKQYEGYIDKQGLIVNKYER